MHIQPIAPSVKVSEVYALLYRSVSRFGDRQRETCPPLILRQSFCAHTAWDLTYHHAQAAHRYLKRDVQTAHISHIRHSTLTSHRLHASLQSQTFECHTEIVPLWSLSRCSLCFSSCPVHVVQYRQYLTTPPYACLPPTSMESAFCDYSYLSASQSKRDIKSVSQSVKQGIMCKCISCTGLFAARPCPWRARVGIFRP